ncbi:MAG: CCA tRNA nucleotidyltransferase [Candidatus Bathyarchaeota archaeon]|nr:CCA tRNA nucleotidyltransferase [Candidatus Bathyarchaeota archaeon]
MQQKINAITSQILREITPTEAQRAKIQALSLQLEQKIVDACKKEGVDAVVRVEGSVAKDTWLTENPDIDVFMKLPKNIPRANLGDVGLKIAKSAAGNAEQIERFAEHPYLQIIQDDMRIDIVPCYNVERGQWQSATDRTPFHTDYIKKNFNPALLGEVRLLKKFMKGIGVYGAEVKIGGFSGYLCELLIMQYQSFAGVVKAFVDFGRRTVIDLEGYFSQNQRDLNLLFPEPFVVIDPVDKARNVASPVQTQKLYTLIAASRAFLQEPDKKFFYPPKTEALPSEELMKQLEHRGSSLMFVVVDQLEAVPDVLWGQLYRTQRSLRKLLELADFKVLKDAVWSNEKTQSVFLFELETAKLPNVKKHLGPPLERNAECQKFLSKYAQNPAVISGPSIEEGKWVVELPRKATDAAALLRDKLADGGKSVGVADLIAKSVVQKLQVLVDEQIADVYSDDVGFAEFLTVFLSGKPFWL